MLRKILQISLATLLSSPSLLTQESKSAEYKLSAYSKEYTYPSEEQKKRAELFQKATQTIENKYRNLPYVWGGDGFEDLKEQIKKYGSCVTPVQPKGSWRTGQPTVPGVDCSGLAFQVLEHMKQMDLEEQQKEKTPKKDLKIRFNYGRLTAEGYAHISEPIAKAKNGDLKEILEKGRPGDLFFLYENGKPIHTGVYLGDNMILECVGTKENISSVPKEELEKWRKYASPKANKKTDNDYGGIQISNLKTRYKEREIELHRLPEFTYKK